MASSSTSSIQKSFKYDVFLSFRGEDTRKNFVDHLYSALQQKSIHTYKDDERIEKGKRISDELIKSIEDSKFYIIVFSKNYASSSWCLDELVKIMECQKTTEQTAYPVFYDVEPSEVRKQSGAVGEAFAKHKKEEAAGKWREALVEAADLAGWELKNTADGHEAKFIQKIVEEISLELRSINSSVDGKLIGMETRIKDVVSSLETGSDDVRMIGIKGMGGGGKTTLARAVFDQISIQFEGKSFVENVREVSKPSLSGLKKLQKQVLRDVLNDQGITVSSVSDGKDMMKKRMCGRKVLVVLDDVDHIDQLEALACEPNWYKPGSRIIITTRDEQVLVAHGVSLIRDVNLLSHEEAICLFSRYAFGREIPIQGYEELSGQVVRYAAGLPLTIRVLGSFLCGKNELEWEDALERLKTIPLEETLKKLELSYIGLEEDYKEIFLDVACILKGSRKEKAIRMLESCGFHARNGLRVLEQKSLITFSIDDFSETLEEYLDMHDHLEEMGRNIVRRLHPDEPNRHSRLWIDEEIEDILANDLGTEATRCIKLGTMELGTEIVMKGLGNMKKLRVLYVYSRSYGDCFRSDCKFDEVSQYFPNTLQYLSWDSYPFSSLPKTFQANNLVGLEMPFSRIVQLWEGGERKVLNKLRFLDLRHSKLRTLDLGLASNIETLSLRECDDLVELRLPLECLKLRSLDLSHLKVTTVDLGLTSNLEMLDLRGCHDLVELHIGCLKLRSLDLSHSKLRTLDLGLTPNLEKLSLAECHDLVELHVPIGCLKKLRFLQLGGCSRFKSFLFDKLFKSLEVGSLAELHLNEERLRICPLHSDNNLPKFQFACCYTEPLPSEEQDPPSMIRILKTLIVISLCACTNLKSFLGSICCLRHLRKLKLEGSIPEAPKDLDQLECLEELMLSSTEIKHLPDSICMLKHLKSLELKSCWLLEKLPEDLGRLECLEKLHFLSTRIKHLPDSICMLKHLKSLELKSCWLLEKLPEDLGRLECLEKLILRDCMFLRDIPNSICKMRRLKYFRLRNCIPVKKLPEELGCLECLKELNIEGTGISHLPQSISLLKGLCIVGSRWLLQSCGFTSEIQAREYVTFCYI